jgi:DNA-binding response OmpR family regulator
MSNPDNASESLHGLRILLVEDDPLICLDLKTSMAELGALVTAASNVAAALPIMAASALDFAVLDFELGVETSEPVAAAARERRMPFLFLSGYSEQDERFVRWPGIPILVKPISTVTLARRIHEMLGGGS